jgi:membrane protease YdiL (CAAX protease family)
MSETKEELQDDSNKQSAPLSNEQEKQPLTSQQRTDRWFQVFTAILLGVVAVVTAWSGYQATRWAGEQSTLYAQASALRVVATRDSTLAGQLKLYDFIAVNNWLTAYTQGNTKLANIFERRFSAELRPAFEAWLATNPFNNPNAPAGPLFMPQYKVSLEATANQLDAQAANTFDRGQAAKEQGDAYVLNTVFLATVLFLTAIAENFKWNRVRAVILAVALVMPLFGIYHLIVYPII